jgi:hypothetical protein
MSNGPWTDEENDLIVADYFAMLADDISARRYSKAEHPRALLPLLNDRSEGSVEFKHQNISAATGAKRMLEGVDLSSDRCSTSRRCDGVPNEKTLDCLSGRHRPFYDRVWRRQR